MAVENLRPSLISPEIVSDKVQLWRARISRQLDNLTIRQRIVTGYVAMVTVVAMGAIMGWGIGSFHHNQALQTRSSIRREQQLLDRLQVAILTVRPGKHLLNSLEDPLQFRRSSQQLLGRIVAVRAALETHHDAEHHDGEHHDEVHHASGEHHLHGLEHTQSFDALHNTLLKYEAITEAFFNSAVATVDGVKARLTSSEPDQLERSRAEIVQLIQSDEFAAYIGFAEQLHELKVRLRKREDAALEELETTAGRRINITLLVVLVSLGMTVIVARYMGAAIARPIGDVIQVSHDIAENENFDTRIAWDRQGEIGDLGRALNILLDKVDELLGQVQDRNSRLADALKKLQNHKIINDRMTSLSQVVAGVAHEINNPITFVSSNLPHLREYCDDLLLLVKAYEEAFPEGETAVDAVAEEIDLAFLREDLPQVFGSLATGAERVAQIVLSLRSFAHLDEEGLKQTDIHRGLENTLTILQHRLGGDRSRWQFQVNKKYGTLPLVECYAGLINQVFLNILDNALDALEDHFFKGDSSAFLDGRSPRQPALALGETDPPGGTLTIETAFLANQDQVEIRITNTGDPIPESLKKRIFDPFFTTKAIGSGTGMGLAICHQVVTDTHGGSLTCVSPANGQGGVAFIVRIPRQQSLKNPSPPRFNHSEGAEGSDRREFLVR